MSKLALIITAVLVVASAPARSEETIPWRHPSLELVRRSVHPRDADRVQIEFCVQPKEGFQEGTTSVGFPRYRIGTGRWNDCVIFGNQRGRPLHASHHEGPACFSVLVPSVASTVELQLDDQPLEVPLGDLLELHTSEPEQDVQVDDPWTLKPAAEPEIVLASERTVEGASVPIPRDHIVSVHLRVQNVGTGTSHGLVASIEPGSGVFAANDGATRVELGELAPRGAADFVYRCYADRNAAALSFQVTFRDADGASTPAGWVVSFPVAPVTAPPVVASDVDGDVAAASSARPDALAVVLGVGDYAKAPAATDAAADAKTAARYFEKVLGVPATRIEVAIDGAVSLGQMQRIFGAGGWLARRVQPDSEVFVFFAGHGMADPETFSPYLLPADADPDYLRQTGVSLDKMIEMVASLGAKRTTFFLDACFSGLSREGNALLTDGRPLVIEQAHRAPAGLSIFSAASGGQVASALREQGHGLFSYSLFKGLAGDADLDHDHRILASELKSYLEDAVPRAALALGREQTPAIALADPEQVLVQLP